jgi:type IV secretory pathway VirB2 component (pilin)
MEELYPWVVLLHVIAAFTFALAHGVSAGVALKLRGERELPRVQALLDLSQVATGGMYGSIVVLLIAGIAAAFIAGLWRKGWIWAAIVLLVLMFAAMYARAPTWFGQVRRAAGQPYFVMGKWCEDGGAARRRDARGPHRLGPADGDRSDRLRRARADPVADGDEALAVGDSGAN